MCVYIYIYRDPQPYERACGRACARVRARAKVSVSTLVARNPATSLE